MKESEAQQLELLQKTHKILCKGIFNNERNRGVFSNDMLLSAFGGLYDKYRKKPSLGKNGSK